MMTSDRLLELVIDILPGLKAGDSYGAQARHDAAPESLRRVPLVRCNLEGKYSFTLPQFPGLRS